MDQQSSGRIAPKVSEAPSAVSEAKDQVRVSKTDTGPATEAGSASTANSARLQALEGTCWLVTSPQGKRTGVAELERTSSSCSS